MMLNHPEQRFLSIAEMSELVHQQQVSPIDLVNECLQRIKQLNPILNAFITVTADQAMQDAVIADRDIKAGNWKGPLHGIPIALKDFFDTAGIRTTAAFAHFKDRIPAQDAEVVTKLKAAGAIVLGKTNMHELGSGTTSLISYFGSVHNPWHPDYVAGGSSGGSAAAVAAGLCYATVDTDAVGSCRLPAACCGVTGFKATYGLISTKGILDGEPADDIIIRLSHAAITCRTAEDVSLMLNVLADPDVTPTNAATDYRPAVDAAANLRIGIVNNYQATEEVRSAYLDAVDVLKLLGHSTNLIEAPLSPPFDVTNIEQDRRTISASLFGEIDVLVLPTLTAAPLTIADATVKGALAIASDNTFFCNYYALPAISVPCGFSQAGLPLGLQIVGAQWREADVLALAHAFQQATTWHAQHPSVTAAEKHS